MWVKLTVCMHTNMHVCVYVAIERPELQQFAFGALVGVWHLPLEGPSSLKWNI